MNALLALPKRNLVGITQQQSSKFNMSLPASMNALLALPLAKQANLAGRDMNLATAAV